MNYFGRGFEGYARRGGNSSIISCKKTKNILTGLTVLDLVLDLMNRLTWTHKPDGGSRPISSAAYPGSQGMQLSFWDEKEIMEESLKSVVYWNMSINYIRKKLNTGGF